MVGLSFTGYTYVFWMNDELKRRVGRVREDILSGHVWFGNLLSYALEFRRKTVIFWFWGSCKRFTCTGGAVSLFSRCFLNWFTVNTQLCRWPFLQAINRLIEIKTIDWHTQLGTITNIVMQCGQRSRCGKNDFVNVCYATRVWSLW